MWSSRSYLTAFAGIHRIDDAAERRRVARQGLAMLAQIAEREPAPLEGLPADQLLLAVRIALGDGILAGLDWMSPAAGAIAMFALAQALPPGVERRELGRRVLTLLRDADRETFVRLVVALARSSPKLLASDSLRARVEVVLSAPLTMQGGVGELALGVLAQPGLAASWVELPATGSLPGRRLAARILAHGAREAVRRHDAGDRGGSHVLARPTLRAALARLLGDREALVWRFACIARGLLAHVDSGLADDIDRELRPNASSTDLRRAAASAAAALERGGAASRWESVVIERAGKEPGVARGALLGLAGLAVAAPDDADRFACALIERAPLDAVEGLAELRREEGSALLPRATAAAIAWTQQQLAIAQASIALQRNLAQSQPIAIAQLAHAPTQPVGVAMLHGLDPASRATPTPPHGIAPIARSTPPHGIAQTPTPPHGIAPVARSTPPHGIAQTPTPPHGIAPVTRSTPPHGIAQTPTPPHGIAPVTQSTPHGIAPTQTQAIRNLAIDDARTQPMAVMKGGFETQPIAMQRVTGQVATVDDGRWGLLHALDAELGAGPHSDGVGIPLAAARAAFDAGDLPGALREARAAVDEVTAMADWLERATDDDPIDRRHSMRILRELDREVLGDNTLAAVLALAPDTDPAPADFARALDAIERALLAREAKPEAGAVAHGGLRIARLRALVRILDGVRVRREGDADVEPRLVVLRQLMRRAAADHSPLRRAVWAALTRAGEALLRDGHAEITDLLLAWAMVFPDDDFAIVREAAMVPEVDAAFEAYARLHEATWAAADPDDTAAIRNVVEKLGELADALPPERSPRVESVRLAVARLGNLMMRVTAVASHADLGAETPQAIAVELGALARRVDGACRRLGIPRDAPRDGSPDGDPGDELEADARAIDLTADAAQLEEAVACTIDASRACLPPAVSAALERVLTWLVRRPGARTAEAVAATPSNEAILPTWVPLSRLLGSYYVVRPIGRGTGGSVLLAVRADERARPDRQFVALKVPDYSGGAARNLSEQEFEAMFREEAGALLQLPQHANIAQFLTFDARAQPKPLLAMEFVPGTNLEQVINNNALDIPRSLAIIDGLLAGLEAMHGVQIAHLDVKPANVVLREGNGVAVLVDFGLAGRRLRAGCGSVHYGAAEVWSDGPTGEPFPADVYAATCVAFEILTASVLIRGDSLKGVVDEHFTRQPASAVLAQVERMPRLASLAELLRAGVAREPKRRPTAARLRAGFAAIAPDLRALKWPIDVPA